MLDLSNKRYLIFGLANKWSLAYYIALFLHTASSMQHSFSLVMPEPIL